MPLYRDPIEGLVQYVKDIKPYHTKLIDVVVTYTYEERINTTVLDNLYTTITFNMDYSREPCLFGYDTDGYDSTAYNIPDFGYAINHSNAYHIECSLTGCERYYSITTTDPINVNTTLSLPFEYLYGIEILYVYINGILNNHVFEQVRPPLYDNTGLDIDDKLNTNALICTHTISSGSKILITTHQIGPDNQCWPDLAASGFESHTFDEHDFDLIDPNFDRWHIGFAENAMDFSPFDMPDPDSTSRSCKCPIFTPYSSPTSILPTILEDIKFIDMMTFIDNINVNVFDWSDNWTKGYDLSPYNQYNFDINSLWDTVDTEYNFGSSDLPILISSNFTIIETVTDNISITMQDIWTQTDIIDNENNNLGYDILTIDAYGFDANNAIEVKADTTIVEAYTITEVLEFTDIIGVHVADPSCSVSGWAMDWGQDNFWYYMLPDLTGWDTNPLWDDNTVNWVQLPTIGGFECDNLGFDANDFDNDQIWSCLPCSLVGGFDDSMGFDEYYNDTTYEVYENIPNMLGFDQSPLWNNYPTNDDNAEFTYSCMSNILTDSVITITRAEGTLMSFIYYQTVPSTSWIISHNLSVYPIIRVFTLDGIEVYPESITHISTDTACIKFNEPATGIIRFI